MHHKNKRIQPCSTSHPKCVKSFATEKKPQISVVITVFNQESLIGEVMRAVCSCVTQFFELILIDDGSEDNTLVEIIRALDGSDFKFEYLTNFSLYQNDVSRFETICDDFGIRVSKSPTVLLLQADILVTEKGFDKSMCDALAMNSDLIMLSGRGTEMLKPIIEFYKTTSGSNIQIGPVTSRLISIAARLPLTAGSSLLLACITKAENRLFRTLRKSQRNDSTSISPSSIDCDELFPDSKTFAGEGDAGRLSPDSLEHYTSAPRKNVMWVSQTVMRGPLLVDKKKYLSVSGFDTDRFFLGFDDHDLAFRAYSQFGFRVGYVPIAFESDFGWGTTRKPRSLSQTRLALTNILRVSRNYRSSALFSADFEDQNSFPFPEIRSLKN